MLEQSRPSAHALDTAISICIMKAKYLAPQENNSKDVEI